MTEEPTGRGRLAPHWPERTEDRSLSPTPAKLEPHPDKEHHPQWDGLPPCGWDSGTGKPCHRSALWHYGRGYYCEEHLEAIQAGEDFDEADVAVVHARRFLWKASVEGIESLEYHIGVALGELVKERIKAEQQMNAAYEKAGIRDTR